MYLNLPDPAAALSTRAEYSIRLANDATWENATGYNDLKHTINVGTALGVDDHALAANLRVYPVPTNNELIVQYDGIEDFRVETSV